MAIPTAARILAASPTSRICVDTILRLEATSSPPTCLCAFQVISIEHAICDCVFTNLLNLLLLWCCQCSMLRIVAMDSVTSVVRGLQEIRTRYQESSPTLAAIETQCEMFEADVRFIQTWLKANRQRHSLEVQEQRNSLNNALFSINEAMMSLQRDITKVLGGGESADGTAFVWVVASKYKWNEDVMKAHLADIRARASVVQSALSALHG